MEASGNAPYRCVSVAIGFIGDSERPEGQKGPTLRRREGLEGDSDWRI